MPESIAECRGSGLVPRIMHQSWKTDILPRKYKEWQKSIIDLHSGWEYRLWTDAQNLRLVLDKFPWFLETYIGLPRNIQRADAARYMYMYEYGGFYMDLDVEALRSHESLRPCGGILVPLMSTDYKFEHNVPNAWMGSVPGHPFWIHMLEKIKTDLVSNSDAGAEALTGPAQEFNALNGFKAKYYQELYYGKVNYVEAGLIFPYDWHNNGGLADICSAQSPIFNTTHCHEKMHLDHRAYTITYWSHAWDDETSLANLHT